jgi:hypothetical protein
MLSLGSSKHWTHALKLLTGEDSIKADAILEYFQPLHDWLIAENAKHPNERVGWSDDKPTITSKLGILISLGLFVFVSSMLIVCICKSKWCNYLQSSGAGYSLVMNESESNIIGTSL